jgi:heat shock protein HslJ
MAAKYNCIILILCIAVLSGCHTSQSEQAPTSEDRTAITSANLNRIAGMQWTLQKMTVGSKDYEIADKKPFIKFEKDSRVGGFASVNRFFGSMEIDDKGNVKWGGPFGVTRMAGPPNLMKQEDTFLKALQAADSLSIVKTYLHIQTSDAQTQLTFYVPVK